jgi:hypothetical protein
MRKIEQGRHDDYWAPLVLLLSPRPIIVGAWVTAYGPHRLQVRRSFRPNPLKKIISAQNHRYPIASLAMLT